MVENVGDSIYLCLVTFLELGLSEPIWWPTAARFAVVEWNLFVFLMRLEREGNIASVQKPY